MCSELKKKKKSFNKVDLSSLASLELASWQNQFNHSTAGSTKIGLQGVHCSNKKLTH